VNELLRLAMLRARLSEDDVAARLQVDPKTVRRWLEGRVPYLRHRWVLTGLLDADEADLWPEVRAAITARSRPADLKAVYPTRQAVTREAWQSLFRSARHEIDILARSALFLARDPDVVEVLADQARAGVRVRICLQNPDLSPAEGETEIKTAEIEEALALFGGLRDHGAQTRLHRAVLYNSVYRADDQMLVTQHVYGLPAEREPVLHLRAEAASDMTTTYLDVVERIWAEASPTG
jgi:phosphatidylserine/phosphatidylglycerophosphate/cardiolipin synthase-like enzyme